MDSTNTAINSSPAFIQFFARLNANPELQDRWSSDRAALLTESRLSETERETLSTISDHNLRELISSMTVPAVGILPCAIEA